MRSPTSTSRLFDAPLKRTARMFVIMVVAGGLAAGCGHATQRIAGPPAPGAASMSATVDDTLCSTGANSGPNATYHEAGANSTLVVDGMLFGPDGRIAGTIHLELHGSLASGTYALTELGLGSGSVTTGSLGALVVASGGAAWQTDPAHVGALVISRLDPVGSRVEGTFEFDGVDPTHGSIRRVHSGTFSSPLVIIP